jgi:small multidrug resistance pump
MSAGMMLGIAIFTEVIATVLLRVSDGFTNRPVAAVSILGYAISVFFLARALRDIDIGVAYAIWSGAGTAIVATVGIMVWSEPIDALKLASLFAVVAGVVGLNVVGGH